jgi:hypothetical protein
MTTAFFVPFREMVPTREQFDAMNDCAFCDWWDAFEQKVSDTTMSDDCCEAVRAARVEAETARGW